MDRNIWVDMKKIKNDKILIKMSQIGASQVFSKVDFFYKKCQVEPINF